MTAVPIPSSRPSAEQLATLREAVARVAAARGPVLPFGVGPLDHLLAGGGLDGAGLHEIAAASASWSDDAAATLFAAGIAARFAAAPGVSALWALTRFDLYAPGLEQAGLSPEHILYAQGRSDRDLLAMCEDALRDGSLACVIAEVKAADQTATRRLQLAASEGNTPMLLYRRYRRYGQCPLADPSLAMTRWRIGTLSSGRLTAPGVGRGRWNVELVRQRGGPPFSLELEACDDQGRLALPAAAADRAVAAGGAAKFAA
ncbi:ImuA family protein [Sphingopyxis granuli]|uniref:Damage-induced mutaganesis protein ImuA n=1 Tax=Sphingopyxis granuli TaxID=267128 RepID=A0AA86GP01_9SPHN|nr:protein ImuA [Sphingopyxis granuli]AMG75544.1 Putative damage-induced mutaganesis protein ImuA [Sphingopyxis granuli]